MKRCAENAVGQDRQKRICLLFTCPSTGRYASICIHIYSRSIRRTRFRLLFQSPLTCVAAAFMRSAVQQCAFGAHCTTTVAATLQSPECCDETHTGSRWPPEKPASIARNYLIMLHDRTCWSPARMFPGRPLTPPLHQLVAHFLGAVGTLRQLHDGMQRQQHIGARLGRLVRQVRVQHTQRCLVADDEHRRLLSHQLNDDWLQPVHDVLVRLAARVAVRKLVLRARGILLRHRCSHLLVCHAVTDAGVDLIQRFPLQAQAVLARKGESAMKHAGSIVLPRGVLQGQRQRAASS